MGVYAHLQQAWKKPKQGLGTQWKSKLMSWRREQTTVRLDHPTRIDRARALGFKAKPGIFVVRQRLPKGPHRRTWTGGRMSKNMRTVKALRKSYQLIAEERANKKFVNCEVLNSYWVAEDGKHYWYEVIFADPMHPSVIADPHTKWVMGQRHRVFRGLTSAGKEMRGLHVKGKGAEKSRPSRRANDL